MLVNIGPVINKPLHAPFEAGQHIDQFGFQDGNGEQRDEADHRAYFQQRIWLL